MLDNQQKWKYLNIKLSNTFSLQYIQHPNTFSVPTHSICQHIPSQHIQPVNTFNLSTHSASQYIQSPNTFNLPTCSPFQHIQVFSTSQQTHSTSQHICPLFTFNQYIFVFQQIQPPTHSAYQHIQPSNKCVLIFVFQHI